MNDSQSKNTNPTAILAAIAIVAALMFAFLWLQERNQIPAEVVRGVPRQVEVIKEVPVERIREVTNEVIKEVKVPAKFSDGEQAAIDFAARLFSAPTLTNYDEALFKLDAISVRVQVNDAVKRLISEDRVKNKFELILRKHNIRLDENAPVSLTLSYDGLWNKDEIIYLASVRLKQHATIARNGDYRRAFVTVWEEEGVGFAGNKVAAEAVLNDVEEKAEAFANKYLSIQERIK